MLVAYCRWLTNGIPVPARSWVKSVTLVCSSAKAVETKQDKLELELEQLYFKPLSTISYRISFLQPAAGTSDNNCWCSFKFRNGQFNSITDNIIRMSTYYMYNAKLSILDFKMAATLWILRSTSIGFSGYENIGLAIWRVSVMALISEILGEIGILGGHFKFQDGGHQGAFQRWVLIDFWPHACLVQACQVSCFFPQSGLLFPLAAGLIV